MRQNLSFWAKIHGANLTLSTNTLTTVNHGGAFPQQRLKSNVHKCHATNLKNLEQVSKLVGKRQYYQVLVWSDWILTQAALKIFFCSNNELWLRAYWFAIEMLTWTICLSVICNPDKSDGWICRVESNSFLQNYSFDFYFIIFFFWYFEQWGHHTGRESWVSLGFWDWSSLKPFPYIYLNACNQAKITCLMEMVCKTESIQSAFYLLIMVTGNIKL